MNHHSYLMILDCLDCSDVSTNFLVVVTTNFMLSILIWADPSRIVHLFAIICVDTIPFSDTISYNQ